MTSGATASLDLWETSPTHQKWTNKQTNRQVAYGPQHPNIIYFQVSIPHSLGFLKILQSYWQYSLSNGLLGDFHFHFRTLIACLSISNLSLHAAQARIPCPPAGLFRTSLLLDYLFTTDGLRPSMWKSQSSFRVLSCTRKVVGLIHLQKLRVLLVNNWDHVWDVQSGCVCALADSWT